MSTSAEFGSLTCVAQLNKVHGNTIQSLSGGLLVMLMISAPEFLVGLIVCVYFDTRGFRVHCASTLQLC